MMRLKRARWLREWAANDTASWPRGIPELRLWMFKRGYIADADNGRSRTLRVTDAGRVALDQAIADHARHGRPNLGEPSPEQRARRAAAEEHDRELERHPAPRWRPSLDQERLAHGPSGAPEIPSAGARVTKGLWLDSMLVDEVAMRNLMETLAQIRTWCVMEGVTADVLKALEPARSFPRTSFVDLSMDEALRGEAAPPRSPEDIASMLLASTEAGDLVVTHGRPALGVAQACSALRRRVLVVVPVSEGKAVKAALASLSWAPMPALIEKPTDAYVARMEGQRGAPSPEKITVESKPA